MLMHCTRGTAQSGASILTCWHSLLIRRYLLLMKKSYSYFSPLTMSALQYSVSLLCTWISRIILYCSMLDCIELERRRFCMCIVCVFFFYKKGILTYAFNLDDLHSFVHTVHGRPAACWCTRVWLKGMLVAFSAPCFEWGWGTALLRPGIDSKITWVAVGYAVVVASALNYYLMVRTLSK